MPTSEVEPTTSEVTDNDRKSLWRDMVHHYTKNGELWAEIHTNLLDPKERTLQSKTINGMNMGEQIFVGFLERYRSIIKIGEDEVIFKMY